MTRTTPIVEDQERPLIWARDPDPLSLELDPRYQQGWVDGIAHSMVVEEARARRRDRLGIIAVLAAAGALIAVGFVAGRASAAPRPAPEHQSPATPGRLTAQGPTGVPLPSGPERSQATAGSAPEVVSPPPARTPSTSSTTGVASWFDDGPGLYAAVPSWHFGDRRYHVRVTAGDRSVIVTVRDFCGCPGGRVIDRSPEAFARLAPLSRGLVRVTV